MVLDKAQNKECHWAKGAKMDKQIMAFKTEMVLFFILLE